MKVLLSNGTELDAIVVNGSSRHFQGASRDSLEFQFAKTIPQTFDELDTLFSNSLNTSKITLVSDTASYIHDNYSLKVQMALIPVVIAVATDTTPEVVEERYSVVMARKTYSELQMESLQETVDILVLESLGV